MRARLVGRAFFVCGEVGDAVEDEVRFEDVGEMMWGAELVRSGGGWWVHRRPGAIVGRLWCRMVRSQSIRQVASLCDGDVRTQVDMRYVSWITRI